MKIIVVIFLLYSCSSANYQKKDTILYELKMIDTQAFNHYNYYEFMSNNKTYKILSEKKREPCELSFSKPLEVGEKYNLSLNEIWIVKINDTLDIDLSKIRMTGNDKSIFVGGNPNNITFLSSNICDGQILRKNFK